MAATKKNHLEDKYSEFENSPFAILVHDQNSIYYANSAAIETLNPGSKQQKPKYPMPLPGLVDPGQIQVFQNHCKAALKKKGPVEISLGLAGAKNKNQYIRFTTKSWTKDGEKRLISTLITTNTDGALANAFQVVSENSPDVLFCMSFYPQTSITYISDSCQNVLGFTQKEIYQDPKIIEPYLQGEDKKFAIASKEDYLKLMSELKENRSQVRFQNKKGETKFLEVIGNPVLDDEKHLIGLVGSIRDITDRMLTEDLLVETKSKFDLITNYGNNIIAFYTYQPTDRYIYVSPNIEKILGFKPEQLLSDPFFFSKRLHSNKSAFLEGESDMSRCQQNNDFKSFKHIYRIANASGKEVWLENSSTPIMNNKGKVGFYLNIMKDVTEEKIKELEIEKQYINYRELLDNSPAAYIIHDKGRVLYSNVQLQNLLKSTEQELLGRHIVEFFTGDSKEKATNRLKDIYNQTNLNQFYNYTLKDKLGEEIEVEVKSVFVKFENKDCVLSLVNNLSRKKVIAKEKEIMKATAVQNVQLEKEIRVRQVVEKSLIEKTAHLTSILESSTHLIWTVDREFRLTSFNENFAKVVRMQHDVNLKPGDRIDELLKRNKKEYAEYWYPIYNEAFQGKKLEFEKKDYIENRGEVHRRVFINPIFGENKQIREISCIANDITDSKLYEKKLINQTAKLTAIFDSSHHYIWTIDRQERLTSFNKNYFDIISSLYNTKPYLGLVLNRGILSNNTEYNKLLKQNYKVAFEGRATAFELEIIDKNNKKVYLEVFLNPIFEKDKVIEVSGIAHNITEKKQAQHKIEVSLKEKEILLREVHHRVKNNMQVVSSILNLQSSYVSDEYALALLKESQNRIKTMAYIHESLYQNKSFSSVNFSEYVRTLINNIIHSYSYSKEKIRLELNIEPVILPLDSSIPAGLIINELVTNAIKHAFPGMRQGTITLDLKYEKEFVFLALKDDGVGFKDNVSFQNSNSLGLQLVNTLIEQIDGVYKFKSEKDIGTEIQVTFKT
ncbi:MAG TPA: PAS domain S-box protein [Bacteroidia bacterium]|nr:PAS domain S-box protein [Bacteroidia bacterium]